jgi:hypothetical protein
MGMWPSLHKRTVMGVNKYLLLMDRMIVEFWQNGPGNAVPVTGG